METSILHLCIPHYEVKEKDGLIVPSGCSLNALSVLLNERSNSRHTYHFPVYDTNDQPSNVVIIRNLPSDFALDSADGRRRIGNLFGSPFERRRTDRLANGGDELKSMIEDVCRIVSIEQAVSQYSLPDRRYGVVRVTLHSSDEGRRVCARMHGSEFHGCCLSVSLRINKEVSVEDSLPSDN